MRINGRSVEGYDLFAQMMRSIAIIPLLFSALAAPLFAGTLDAKITMMFPRDAGEIGYADLSQARQLPWFPQFEAQLVPVSFFQFEQLLIAAQGGQTSNVDQVAWSGFASGRSAASDDQRAAVAIGHFDSGSIRSFLETRKIPAVEFRNYQLYPGGIGSGASDIYFSIVDWDTIAFGPLPLLQRVLATRDREVDNVLQNEAMTTLINSANTDCIFWSVYDSAQTGAALAGLVPAAGNLLNLTGKTSGLLMTVKPSSDINFELQAGATSPGDALMISQLIHAGVALKRAQVKADNNPELAHILDTVSVSTKGTFIDISLQLTNDQIVSLIEHNTFAAAL